MTEKRLYDLRVTVERIEGRSLCGLEVGDWFEITESSRVRIPEGKQRLHVLRLSDGTDAVVAAGTAARFGDAGLFYAHEAPAPYRGRITVLPFGSLPG